MNKVTEKIIACAIEVHKELDCGFLESMYQSAWAKEVRLIINFNALKGLQIITKKTLRPLWL